MVVVVVGGMVVVGDQQSVKALLVLTKDSRPTSPCRQCTAAAWFDWYLW